MQAQKGRSEVIAIDAVEETIDGKIKILLALAVAEVSQEYSYHYNSFLKHHLCKESGDRK
jgi:hypothetical protein